VSDPDQIRKRISEPQTILAALGLPPDQQKLVPVLTFLALCRLSPDMSWREASNPLIGVSPILDYVNAHYGVSYRENSRETFRKSAIHYFEAAHLIAKNPDNPNRPINSGKTVYQLTDDALSLIQSFGTDEWGERLPAYMAVMGSLTDRFSARRTLEHVPLKMLPGRSVTLSVGPHSDLIEQVIFQFGPRFTPGGTLIYAGDTGQKWDSYFDETTFEGLGVVVASTGTKMPDVVIYHEAKKWLVVAEAFDTVGPIDPLRRTQLEELFAASTAPRVYVTAFHDRRAMASQAARLAWETEIWIAEAPDHLIHYNGERFLGPYE
jgi:adenine-specific DNA-methyltransferase